MCKSYISLSECDVRLRNQVAEQVCKYVMLHSKKGSIRDFEEFKEVIEGELRDQIEEEVTKFYAFIMNEQVTISDEDLFTLYKDFWS